MPDYFTIQDKSYTIKYEHEHLKHAKLTNDSSQSELNTSLQYVFTVSDKIIMILDRYMMAVYKRIGGQYLFFDSHSRNEYGLVAGEGTSVALIFDSFQNLLNYLVQLIHSLRSRFFALLPVVVTVNSNTELSQESVHANNRSETDIAGCSTWNDIQLITGSNDLSSNSTDVTTPSDEQISSNQRQSVRTGLESNANQLSFDQTTLRVRAFFHKTVRDCHVYCKFKIGCTCRITVIFGTLKDGSLLINTLVSNICFSYRNMFQNGVDTLSKIVDAFLSKSSKFYLVRIIR